MHRFMVFPVRPVRFRLVRRCLVAWAVLATILSAGPLRAQIVRLPHPDTTAGNFFGVSVAIEGDRAVVGASSEDACGPNSGAAYVFERDPQTDTWAPAARLLADDCAGGDYFGRSLDLSGDRILVGAARGILNLQAGNAAYVFERDTLTGTWVQTAKLEGDPEAEAAEGAFATSVSLDHDRALITTSGDPSDGRSHGAAYIFERRPDGSWQQAARLTGNGPLRTGIFGGNGVIEGDRAVVAASTYFAYRPGSIYVFEREPATNTWRPVRRFGGIDDFFISLDLDGDRILVGESKGGRRQSGEASLFQRTADGTWEAADTIRPATPYDHGAFGATVALQGDRLLATGYDEQLRFDFNIDRVVYVFARDAQTGSWRQRHVIDIGAVAFGTAIDLDGPYAIIGQASDDAPGAAYIVRIR
ncbi:MAG: hypothetical protein D6685_15090 [Bacteroidetes bacterium]|nr:MAG: hypothetical protein D6685_15090 [Bacteroidota bacterium]